MKNNTKQIYLKSLETKKVWVFCNWGICENLASEIDSFQNKIEEISLNSEKLELKNIIKIVEKNNGKKDKLLFIKKDFKNFKEMLNITWEEFFKQTWWKIELENIFWHINPIVLDKFWKFFKQEYLDFFEKLLVLIADEKVQRIHIFTDYKEGFLEEELLTASWAKDTILVSNNFEFEKEKANINHIGFIEDYIKQNPNIKPRTKEYIEENIDSFYILKIDNIAIGIFELKKIWEKVIEIWALALSERWQKRGLWKLTNEFIINNFSEFNQIFVTPNDALASILLKLWLEEIKQKFWNKIFDERFEKMLEDNKKDGKNRKLFVKK